MVVMANILHNFLVACLCMCPVLLRRTSFNAAGESRMGSHGSPSSGTGIDGICLPNLLSAPRRRDLEALTGVLLHSVGLEEERQGVRAVWLDLATSRSLPPGRPLAHPPASPPSLLPSLPRCFASSCLPSCLAASLPACRPALPPSCLSAFLPSCLPTGLPAPRLPASLPPDFPGSPPCRHRASLAAGLSAFPLFSCKVVC